ncbi:MAG: radical SAM protein [Treponema sp.]|nr:radical SAM protein [Treponema sp.]MCL2250844.1 radical SAM protein [Treponema sp.]
MSIIKNILKKCTLCPRNCGVNRLAGEKGFCKETSELRVAVAVIHKGEEPPLVGTGGSGTIFISGCNLGCVFCQNYQVSQGAAGTESLGKKVSSNDFAKICEALRDAGAENINIVTGSHAIPAIIEGLIAARDIGVQIPVLWNCSGYETPFALELLKDYVDVFLPDLKTLDSEIAKKFFNAPDYPEAAVKAILKMIELTQHTDNDKSKVIIRHLIIPGFLESTRSVLKWFSDKTNSVCVKDHALLSLMTQYTPIPNRGTHGSLETQIAPQRYLSEEEYCTVLNWLEEFEIEDGFCQELVTGNDWLPDFRRTNPFPSKLSIPVWSM